MHVFGIPALAFVLDHHVIATRWLIAGPREHELLGSVVSHLTSPDLENTPIVNQDTQWIVDRPIGIELKR